MNLSAMVEELQRLPIPVCSTKIFGLDGLPTEEADAYLSAFLPPRVDKEGKAILCVCGKRLWSGSILDALGMASFTWGLVHGHGFCSACHYPCVMYHTVSEGKNFTFPLQPHADTLGKPDAVQ